MAALRAEQDEEHRAAWSRLSALVDIGAPGQAALTPAVAIGEEFAASEASRGRRHAALLAEVADDAAATGRVLAESSALVGGTGRPGDDGRALAHLAALLPGWGDEELAARGAALAVALTGGPVSPEEMNDLARAADAYAGIEGVRECLAHRRSGKRACGTCSPVWASTPSAPTPRSPGSCHRRSAPP